MSCGISIELRDITKKMESYLKAADNKAIEAGVPVAPVVDKPATKQAKSKTLIEATNPVTTAIASQTRVPGSAVSKSETLLEAISGCAETLAEIEASQPVASKDGRVIINKRNTFKGEAYGSVTSVKVDGFTRTFFKHYPVYFLDGYELLEMMKTWAITGKVNPFWAGGAEIRALEPQFEGLCIKVLADNSGNLRFVTKKKAELCAEQENLFMETLASNYRYLNPGATEEAAKLASKAALMTHVLQSDVLTFRLVHPKLSYVNGLIDLARPMAVLTAINDKHVYAETDLPLKGVFITATYVDIDIEKIRFGAVMAELYDAKKGITSYIKLVTHKLAANIKLLEGVNGNIRAHLVKPGMKGRVEEVREALHPYHLPELEAAIKDLNDRASRVNPELVARFVKKNHSQLIDEKDCSGLRKALFKMDTKRAERLLKAAEMYKPAVKRGDFFAAMKSEMMESHIKLLETVEAKLTHSNVEVAAAAKLIKACLA